jgi:hypothetical protein
MHASVCIAYALHNDVLSSKYFGHDCKLVLQIAYGLHNCHLHMGCIITKLQLDRLYNFAYGLHNELHMGCIIIGYALHMGCIMMHCIAIKLQLDRL